EIIDIRSQLRQASAVLPLDLRSVSTVSTVKPAGSPYQPSVLGSDITYMDDKEIRFRSTIGSGVACAVTSLALANTVTLVPAGTLAKGNVLTSWFTPPAINDTVFVFDPGSDAGALDDQWRPYRITAIVKSTTACAGSPFLVAGAAPGGDDGKDRWTLTLVGVSTSPSALPTSIGTGSVIRFTRSVVYGLYAPSTGNAAADTMYYLGYKTMQTSGSPILTASTLQASFDPIAGPFRRWSNGGATNGLAFTYYDSTGAAITNMANTSSVARVDVKLRGQGFEKKNAANMSSQRDRTFFLDSLMLTIAVRNRA
ncbi:MAG TPA: hypothetical protein VFJ74_18010, partial [Gemmatimonadaceae bacterium]|nr:hypothetical protein [Gemmatimonadaceae bacterium]